MDFDEEGIFDSEFFLGPYYFCTPNDQDEPDNCVEVANPELAGGVRLSGSSKK